MKRRTFLKSAVAGLAVSLFSGAYPFVVEPNWLAVSRVDVPLPHLPPALDGFTIAQLSDFHLGPDVSAGEVRRAVDVTNALQPDLVVLTGDYVIVSAADAAACAQELAALRAPFGVRAILGNHDFWTNEAIVDRHLRRAGFDLLRNEHRRLDVGDAALWLAGLEDVWAGQPDLDAALAGIPPDAIIVLLVHEPDFADWATGWGIALQLSGHSHGGQVRLPFLGAPILPYLAHKYPYGRRRVGDLWLYTNRGIGLIPPPVRFNCRPEITLVRMIRQRSG